MNQYKRLTTDNPNTIDARLLNYCYAKDRRVTLRFAGGEEDVDLCEYVAVNVSNTTDCQITAEEAMNGACLACCSGECPIGCLYFAAVQAAELRGRLKEYEDLEVGGKLIQLPCKVGDMVYALWNVPTAQKSIIYCVEITEIRISKRNCRQTTTFLLEPIEYRGRKKEYRLDEFGKTVFLTKEEAEKALRR